MAYAVMVYVVKCADIEAMAMLPRPVGGMAAAEFAADPGEVGAALDMAVHVTRNRLASAGFIPPSKAD